MYVRYADIKNCLYVSLYNNLGKFLHPGNFCIFALHSNYSLTRNNRVVKPYKVQKQILEKLCIQEESPTVGHGQTTVLFRLGRTLEKEQTRIAMCAQMHTQIVLKWHIVSPNFIVYTLLHYFLLKARCALAAGECW